MYIIWGGGYVWYGEIFNIWSSESLLWRRHFSANKNTCKDNELATLRKWNNCFYWLLSGLHIAITTEVALKLSKKYESVRLYLHWPNVPTLTLNIELLFCSVDLFMFYDLSKNYQSSPYPVQKPTTDVNNNKNVRQVSSLAVPRSIPLRMYRPTGQKKQKLTFRRGCGGSSPHIKKNS